MQVHLRRPLWIDSTISGPTEPSTYSNAEFDGSSEFEIMLKPTDNTFDTCSLWRPLKSPVRSAPLAVCDGTTLDESSLVEVHRIRRKFAGCTWSSMYQENIGWYYMSNQTPDELLLFKNFDSMEGTAKCMPTNQRYRKERLTKSARFGSFGF
jgi:hypothetical protein